MLTEFEVRRRIDAIRSSRMSALRKARMLLRIGRSLNKQVKTLNEAKTLISQTADRNAAAGLSRMKCNSQQLRSEVRDAAYEALSVESPKQMISSVN